MNDQNISTEEIELKELRQKAEEYLAGWKRATADYQNLQKEVRREREELARYATGRLIFDLLPVLDNAETALKHVPMESTDDAWVAGIRHVFDGLRGLLRVHGVESMTVLGEKFDPESHEAVGSRKDEQKESGIVVEEVRAGYKLNGKILRPAQVIISE